ncbi:tripartite-type tricarboxylate transporter receptor subunit TctC [Cricetibacter osteomyelitidis]|uniref:Tripartite-type tricarboxylate transporter receptor subunit TctC n=1 Tax=Cricetibacter osteomyelitidis TaxID=1521931 RepID=A0A4R2TRR7_9PAST|nr:tripartite tricarboxylate transporter substrate binding protein [Cricetibacter osteomyelitidis]TCP97732.1 tripartite-type tricarboxylate transporter receptor subunit TctC [Cricetibacter osteomyelitidis]
MKNFKLKTAITALATAAVVFSSSVSAETDWPKRPVNLIVAFSAGGNSDYNARALAKHLTKELGQPVVVSNIAGSGGSIAAAQVKEMKPDGYNVLVTQLSLNIAEASKMVNFGFKDFDPCCVFSAAADEVLVTNAEAPFNTIQELITESEKNPGKYKLAVNTGASTLWIAIGLQQAGAKLNIVSSGGSGERLPLLLGRHVDIIPMPYNMVQTYVDKGQFKYLANVSNVRSKNDKLVNVPTLRESGVPAGYAYYNTMFFPKGTDPEIIAKLSAATGKVINENAEYRKEVEGFFQEPVYMNTEDTIKIWDKEREELLKISDLLQGKK